MEDNGQQDISDSTLKLIKRYLPDMGIRLPLNKKTLSRIIDNFYSQEVIYAMEAEDLRDKGLEWEPTEMVSCMFAEAADEIGDCTECGSMNYRTLSELIEEQVIGPDEKFPEYRK